MAVNIPVTYSSDEGHLPGLKRVFLRAARQLRCVRGCVQRGPGRRSGKEWSGSASGGGKCIRTCDDPRRGGERGSSPRPTRGGRSRTGLARSRTIRDFHGVPESLLRQTHAPDLTPNGGRLCSPRGKPLRASLDSPYCRVLRLGQDCHCKVEHADLQQVVLPRRPDQSAGRTAHCIRPVRVPGGRRRPRSDGAYAGISLLPVPRLGRGTGAGDRRRDAARSDRPHHLRRGGLAHRGASRRGAGRRHRLHFGRRGRRTDR